MFKGFFQGTDTTPNGCEPTQPVLFEAPLVLLRVRPSRAIE